jgi:hypothetical protein
MGIEKRSCLWVILLLITSTIIGIEKRSSLLDTCELLWFICLIQHIHEKIPFCYHLSDLLHMNCVGSVLSDVTCHQPQPAPWKRCLSPPFLLDTPQIPYAIKPPMQALWHQLDLTFCMSMFTYRYPSLMMAGHNGEHTALPEGLLLCRGGSVFRTTTDQKHTSGHTHWREGAFCSPDEPFLCRGGLISLDTPLKHNHGVPWGLRRGVVSGKSLYSSQALSLALRRGVVSWIPRGGKVLWIFLFLEYLRTSWLLQ